MTSIYDFRNYRKFLIAWLKAQPRGGRGLRSSWAEVAGVQTSFLSQVLGGKMDLSTEQAYKLSGCLALTPGETDFFLLLHQRARASAGPFKNFLDKKIEESLQRRQDVSSRIQDTKRVEGEELRKYFSSWIYPALHLGALIPGLSAPAVLADRLGLRFEEVIAGLDALETMGLLEKADVGYKSGAVQMHLPKNSPLLRQHQLNLKHKSIEELLKNREGLNYVSLISVSREDGQKLRELILAFIENHRPMINASEPEQLYILNLELNPISS